MSHHIQIAKAHRHSDLVSITVGHGHVLQRMVQSSREFNMGMRAMDMGRDGVIKMMRKTTGRANLPHHHTISRV
jgi:hypothetical protein